MPQRWCLTLKFHRLEQESVECLISHSLAPRYRMNQRELLKCCLMLMTSYWCVTQPFCGTAAVRVHRAWTGTKASSRNSPCVKMQCFCNQHSLWRDAALDSASFRISIIHNSFKCKPLQRTSRSKLVFEENQKYLRFNEFSLTGNPAMDVNYARSRKRRDFNE